MADVQHFCVGAWSRGLSVYKVHTHKPREPGQDADSAPKAYGRKCFLTSSRGVGTVHTELQGAKFLNAPNSCARKLLYCSSHSTRWKSRHGDVSLGSLSKRSAEQNSSTGGAPAAAVPLSRMGTVGDKWPWEEGVIFKIQAAAQPVWLSG